MIFLFNWFKFHVNFPGCSWVTFQNKDGWWKGIRIIIHRIFKWIFLDSHQVILCHCTGHWKDFFFCLLKFQSKSKLEVPYFGSNKTSPFDWCGIFFFSSLFGHVGICWFFSTFGSRPATNSMSTFRRRGVAEEPQRKLGLPRSQNFCSFPATVDGRTPAPPGMYKTLWKWDIVHIKWCRISSINTMTLRGNTGSSLKSLMNFGVCTGPLLHQCAQLGDA